MYFTNIWLFIKSINKRKGVKIKAGLSWLKGIADQPPIVDTKFLKIGVRKYIFF
jgi:hypothetical protein